MYLLMAYLQSQVIQLDGLWFSLSWMHSGSWLNGAYVCITKPISSIWESICAIAQTMWVRIPHRLFGIWTSKHQQLLQKSWSFFITWYINKKSMEVRLLCPASISGDFFLRRARASLCLSECPSSPWECGHCFLIGVVKCGINLNHWIKNKTSRLRLLT